MSTKRKGRKETKQEPPTQYRVIDPVSLANLENIHTRKGKYPTVPPPFGQPTWEDVKREKEERLRKAKRERSLSTPLESISTDAMDTEEAQEFSKEIAAKAAEKKLRKQRYAEYQLKRQQTTRYDLPRPGSIPVPQLEKPKEKKEPRPQSVLSNFGTPNYEEISTYRQRPPSRSRSVSAAPLESNEEKESQGARPKIPSSNVSAFQDYTSDMMRALNNPWVPKERKTTTPSCTTVAPLVYLSPHGTPVEGQPMEMKGKRGQNGINMSALDNTELIPENMSQIKNPTSPTKFTERLQNGEALGVELQGISLLKTLVFDAQEEGNLEPDFYMPDGKGSKLSETHSMYTAEKTPEDNPGVLVRLDNLRKKYGTSIYLLDKRSGHLYVTGIDSYKRIEEKGLLYPSESMILAGALDRDRSEFQPSIQVSKIQATPAAESTRIPLRTSTDKREVSNQKELLIQNYYWTWNRLGNMKKN